ncbi:MAG: HAD-IA family hydrolase [Clostridiales bacterium]
MEISEIKKYFSIVLSSSEVENGKPEPDVFLEAAKNLDILPENILVFEDSKYGVTASKKAGMACIAVPEKNHELPREFYDANILFNNGIEELQPENILNLINKTKETLKK